MQVSRHLFRWTKEIAYADYYERALINGVLSIQRGRDPGVMIYMLPQGPGRSKAVSYHGWGTQYDSFWCCYGTGIESFSKLGDSIYFEEKGGKPALYIVQYIPSTFNWRSVGLTVTQQVKPLSSSDQNLQVSLSISAKVKQKTFSMMIRWKG
uniref:Non-reducing end beta-L-arabinofuranosidase-like GH127 catalytic domain-containing protein n=1 Tax=Aegilops tauschii subsp. strangulata TaxID=200361 RepID=A0A453SL18_AEGTS